MFNETHKQTNLPFTIGHEGNTTNMEECIKVRRDRQGAFWNWENDLKPMASAKAYSFLWMAYLKLGPKSDKKCVWLKNCLQKLSIQSNWYLVFFFFFVKSIQNFKKRWRDSP